MAFHNGVNLRVQETQKFCQSRSPSTPNARTRRQVRDATNGIELTRTTKVLRIALLFILVYGSSTEKSGNNGSFFNVLMLRTRDTGNGHVISPVEAAVIPIEYFDIRERRELEVQREIVQEFLCCGRV